MMIDPVHSLAFSIQSNRGVYAILLGSGISRAAGIPTGWDITLDLVRKLAVLCNEVPEPDPEYWYKIKFGKPADYSDLLDTLTRTQAERQQLLRRYWEPDNQEREDGKKQPTAAHRSIAALAAQGFVRVILTTNFDRLMETALVDAGVVPTVLSSPDQVHGALPLIHTRCCVFKVHGDYLDTRIRNTADELAQYPQEFSDLLNRIFDEFGLVVCGWSATWDTALRAALMRTLSRRFATYWAMYGEPSDEAQRLITHRAAISIPIITADSFFQSVQEHVESLEQFARPHPLSTEAAVASLKRFLSEPRYRIQFADLIDDTVDRIIEITSGEAFFAKEDAHPRTDESATDRVRAYELACSTLLAMAPIGGFWAEDHHLHAWQRAVERISYSQNLEGAPMWLQLRRYPGTLLIYSLGIGAVESGKLRFLGQLFEIMVKNYGQEPLAAVQLLPASCLLDGRENTKFLKGMEDRFAPLSDRLKSTLWETTQRLIPNEERYTYIFDTLEILMALGCGHRDSLANRHIQYWAPLGGFALRRKNRVRIVQEIEQSISSLKQASPFVESRIFGDSAAVCTENLNTFSDFVQRVLEKWH